MPLKFYRIYVNIQIDSCRIQRNFNADATVLPAKSKEKEPALSVCKLFSLCRSGCSALGFSFSRSGFDRAVPAPQTVHRPQAQSRETPSFPSRFSRSDANGLCNHRNDVCNTIITQQKRSRPLSPAKRTAPEMQCRKSDRNGVADVDQDGVEGLRQSSMYKNISLTRRKLAIHAHPSPSEVPSAESIGVYLTIPPITPPAVDF